MENMHLILGRGKMLDVIIESTVNTDFGGEIRAIISRDVYSEWGRNILIPKGSRVLGTYNIPELMVLTAALQLNGRE